MGLNILVTGGAGYIGSVMVPELLAAGHSVTVLDSFMFGQSGLASSCIHPKFEMVRGDVRDENALRTLLKTADMVIPLAAYVGAPLCQRDPVGATTTNRGGIVSIVKLTSKNQGILMPTTNSGYGIGQPGVLCTEETPLKPISLYGKDKVEAEYAILDRGGAISFRLATAFGMSQRMRMDLLVNDFTYRALNDRFIVLFEGHFKRNFIHVRDVARAFLHGIDNFSSMKDRPYNVGLSDANLSKLELCQVIKEFVPEFVFMEAPVGQDPDKRDYIVSNERIEKTGFKTQVSLRDGIRELIKGYVMLRNTKYSNV
jgi:nucleoside-diphosphate-sugar epimerase